MKDDTFNKVSKKLLICKQWKIKSYCYIQQLIFNELLFIPLSQSRHRALYFESYSIERTSCNFVQFGEIVMLNFFFFFEINVLKKYMLSITVLREKIGIGTNRHLQVALTKNLGNGQENYNRCTTTY